MSGSESAGISEDNTTPGPELRAPVRGRFFKLLHPLASYLVTNVTVTLVWLWFRVLNRTTVIGRSNVGYDRNTLLLSNHQTMIDSFVVGVMAYYPHSWWRPYLIPWNPAAVENFYRNPVLSWFSDLWRCIPIREGRRDLQALRRMIKVFPRGVMTLFPEGTRMRAHKVGRGRSGAGLIMLSARPKVIPVAIDGMDEVLPIVPCGHGCSSTSTCTTERRSSTQITSTCRERSKRRRIWSTASWGASAINTRPSDVCAENPSTR